MPETRNSGLAALSRWSRQFESWLNYTLFRRHLDELRVLDDDAQRRAAVDGMMRRFGRRFTIPVIIVLIASFFVFHWVYPPPHHMQPRWKFHLRAATGLVTTTALIIACAWLARRSAARHLRAYLNEAGHRVCLRCGYDLRGSPAAVCPECGSRQER